MHEGYPVYFVVFFPEPSPGQTLANVFFTLACGSARRPHYRQPCSWRTASSILPNSSFRQGQMWNECIWQL
jgi:hypothetical protein